MTPQGFQQTKAAILLPSLLAGVATRNHEAQGFHRAAASVGLISLVKFFSVALIYFLAWKHNREIFERKKKKIGALEHLSKDG